MCFKICFRYRILSLFFLFFLSYILNAQVVISGYVTDSKSGESLIGATVYDIVQKTGSCTNGYGFFSLKLNSTDKISNLNVSFVGYKTKNVRVVNGQDTLVNIQLTSSNDIQEVVVKGQQLLEETNEISTFRMSAKTIKRLPAFGGEYDVLKALQLMPGVNRGNEMSAGLNVRGGSSDQNLILIDDVPVYYINHLGGFVSTFNADAINSITMIKGGFPARYGSRLSSVIDVKLKEGNNKYFQGDASVGLLSAKAAIQGPIVRDKASYIISYRRMYYDLLLRPITSLTCDGYSFGYNFYDLNAKVNYTINSKNRCYLSLYSGDDRLVFTGKIEEDGVKKGKTKVSHRWGNNIASTRWNHIFSSKLFLNTTLAYTQYRYIAISKTSSDSTNYKYTNMSAIHDCLIKCDLEYYMQDNWILRFGTTGTYHIFIPTETKANGYSSVSSIDYNNVKYGAKEEAVYFENDFKLRNHLGANLGGRFSTFNIDNSNFYSFEPRISVNIPFKQNYALKGGYSTMKQYVHLLSSVGNVFPVDFWVPVTKYLNPEKSQQINMGFVHSMANQKYEISIEGYYKTMNNLIEFKEGVSSLSGITDWESKIDNNGVGESKGLEFMLKKSEGKMTGWINYTLSQTTRQFDDINNGKTYPYKYDRPHAANIALMYDINAKIDVSATWVYQTGSPYTLPVGSYLSLDDEGDLTTAYVYGDRNANRMKDYHRLDLSMNFKKDKKWGQRIWNISIYNVYNRKNPYYYYWQLTKEDSKELINPTLKQICLFTFIPSFSYTMKF